MKKILTLGVASMILGLFTPSCTKKFESINTNPNAPTQAPVTNVLGSVLEGAASTLYSPSRIEQAGSYAGQMSLIQYIQASQYSFSSTLPDPIWTALYAELKNAQSIIAATQTSGATNMQAAAMTIQAFIFQIVTDTWRDVPYTQAIRGDSGFVAPVYDKQETIYPSLIAELKAAGDLFAKNSTDQLGVGDLLYGGDVAKWRKFCNSLRLRMAIRLSNIAPQTAQSNIEEIAGDPTTYPVLSDNSDNAYFVWPGVSPYIEPYGSGLSYDVYGMAEPLIDTLLSLSDPRLPVYAHPAQDDGQYRGVEVGPVGQVNPAHYSRIGARFRDNLAGFSPFMNYAEVKFIYAEAAARGWNTGISAQQAYQDGITVSLQENGIIDGTVINNYINSPGVLWNGDTRKIAVQKWIVLIKQCHEAWAETRRTDTPLLPAAPGSVFPGHNRPPFRLPYPNSETTLNGTNSAPFVANVKDKLWGQQLWWDTRTGVE